MHYGSGILSDAMVGWFSDGTPWTMAWLMWLAGIGSLLTSLLSSHLHARKEQVPCPG
jgi:DHA1 family bicyclomycin/chloramphenicol resistance-like MFS transporter